MGTILLCVSDGGQGAVGFGGEFHADLVAGADFAAHQDVKPILVMSSTCTLDS